MISFPCVLQEFLQETDSEIDIRLQEVDGVYLWKQQLLGKEREQN